MSDIDFDREQAVAQIKMEEAQRTHDREAELHRTNLEVASKSAEVAVKTSVLMNGGAAVAILAFIGGMLGKDIVSVKQVADVSSSLIWFAAGVATGVGALALIYLMNYCAAARVSFRRRTFEHPYVRETSRSLLMKKIYTIAHILAVAASLISLCLFIIGMLDVRASITRFAASVELQPSKQMPKSP
jgi:hypothetical protein